MFGFALKRVAVEGPPAVPSVAARAVAYAQSVFAAVAEDRQAYLLSFLFLLATLWLCFLDESAGSAAEAPAAGEKKALRDDVTECTFELTASSSRDSEESEDQSFEVTYDEFHKLEAEQEASPAAPSSDGKNTPTVDSGSEDQSSAPVEDEVSGDAATSQDTSQDTAAEENTRGDVPATGDAAVVEKHVLEGATEEATEEATPVPDAAVTHSPSFDEVLGMAAEEVAIAASEENTRGDVPAIGVEKHVLEGATEEATEEATPVPDAMTSGPSFDEVLDTLPIAPSAQKDDASTLSLARSAAASSSSASKEATTAGDEAKRGAGGRAARGFSVSLVKRKSIKKTLSKIMK